MDPRPITTPPTEAERQAIDRVLGPAGPDGRATTSLGAAKNQRHLLLPALHAVQARMGWISRGALGYLCERLEVPPAEGFGVASFYALFSLHGRPALVLQVCDFGRQCGHCSLGNCQFADGFGFIGSLGSFAFFWRCIDGYAVSSHCGCIGRIRVGRFVF